MWSRISDPTAFVTSSQSPTESSSDPVRTARRRALQLGPPLTVVLYAAGTLAGAVRLAPLAVAVCCLALAAGLVLTALLTARNLAISIYGSACAVVAGGWLAYAALAGRWSWPPAVILVVAAAILIPAYPEIRRRQELEAEQARLAAAAAEAAREQRKWPDLLARIGHKGIKFAGREETLAGYLVHLRLPSSGRVTYSGLAPATEQLEVAARLRHGSLRFERGTQAHEVILHVAERDVLAETVPLPTTPGSLSITRPIPVGLFEDGQVCAVTLREVATLIVGLRGSGKSNLLNVLLAQLARCPDVLIFAIDLKGGRMAAPWIEPWLAGRTPRPVVDWLATDREEAERMLRALERAIQARSRSGSGGEKITPSPEQPAVLLVCDEIAVILGVGTGGPRSSLDGVTNATLARLATQLVMTGRSEAIDLIMATQRGTVTMLGSADLKSQCAVRIGLGVASEGDARLIIPDDTRIATDLARLAHPGTGIVQQGKNGRVMPVKFYRIEHEMISEIAERYGRVRPGPDKVLEEALGEDYRTRWSPGRIARIPGVGSRPLVPALAGGQQRIPIEAPPQAEALPAGLSAQAEALPAGPSAGMPAISPAVTPAAAPPDGRAEERFAELAASAAQDAGHPARQRMVAMLQSAGVKGLIVRSIADQLSVAGYDVAHQTIHRWLTEEAAAGRVEHASYGRWKWRRDD
jgi:S-DNA-T family DNA segregation ATPase FtsK/SpoIIIE